jgi:hypothetical protein
MSSRLAKRSKTLLSTEPYNIGFKALRRRAEDKENQMIGK